MKLKHLEIVTNAHSPKTRICQQIGPTGSSPCASPPSLKTNACWRSTLSLRHVPSRYDMIYLDIFRVTTEIPGNQWQCSLGIMKSCISLVESSFFKTHQKSWNFLTDNFIAKIPWSKRRRKRVCTRSWLSWPHICFFFSVDKSYTSSCFMLNTNCFAVFGVTSKITSVGCIPSSTSKSHGTVTYLQTTLAPPVPWTLPSAVKRSRALLQHFLIRPSSVSWLNNHILHISHHLFLPNTGRKTWRCNCSISEDAPRHWEL